MVQSKWNFLLVAALSIVLFIPWLGTTEFHTRGEPREAISIRDVSEYGGFLLPRQYGGLIADKPPFLYWVGALASKIEGKTSELSSRIPSALTAVLFITGFYLFLAPRIGERTAFLSCLILMTTAEWFRHSIVCRVDLLLSATLATSLIFAFLDFEKRSTLPSIWTILFASFAVLTKGPIGIVLPAFILSIFFCLRRNSWKAIIKYLSAFVLISAIIPGIWYWVALKRGGEEFWNLFLFENFDRYLGASGENIPHSRNAISFYLTVLAGLLPWSLIIMPELLERGFRSFKKWRRESSILSLGTRKERIQSLLKDEYWRERLLKFFKGVRRISDESTDIKLFSYCTILCILFFFSLSSGKRSVYALPAYPFISILISSYLLHLTRLRHRYIAWSFFVIALFGVAISLSIPIAYFFEVKAVWNINLSSSIKLSVISSALLFSIFVLSMWIFAKIFYASRRSYVPAGLSLVYVLFLFVHAYVSPLFADSLSSKGFSKAVVREIDASEQIYSYDYEFYGVSFYSQRLIKRTTGEFKEGMLILLYEKKLDDLSKVLPSNLKYKIILKSARQIEIPRQHAVIVRLEKTGK